MFKINSNKFRFNLFTKNNFCYNIVVGARLKLATLIERQNFRYLSAPTFNHIAINIERICFLKYLPLKRR